MCLVDKQKNKNKNKGREKGGEGGRQETVGLLFSRQAKRRQATMSLLFVCLLFKPCYSAQHSKIAHYR